MIRDFHDGEIVILQALDGGAHGEGVVETAGDGQRFFEFDELGQGLLHELGSELLHPLERLLLQRAQTLRLGREVLLGEDALRRGAPQLFAHGERAFEVGGFLQREL